MKYLKVNKFKKGFTLVEIVICLAIGTILIAAMSDIYVRNIKQYNIQAKQDRTDFYVNEAYRYIEYITNLNNQSVDIEMGVISIYDTDGEEDKRALIRLRNSKLMLDYVSTKYGSIASDNLLYEVKAFEAEKKNGYISVAIVTLDGRKYCRCIGIKEAQKKDM